ncbi:metalloendoproteinase 2-MMP-like [Aristolochia californica]|uniref:metalloendoproteinase 2-MMP-like n=1 Tax=Aristolochia californica TaxID=171875 RepID=UPI0035DC6089
MKPSSSYFFAAAILLALASVFSVSGDPDITSTAWDSFNKLLGCHNGVNQTGLASLKQYFHYFGYIPDSANYSDSFDDVLEQAIKTYQQNFNLNVSGVLDASTVAHVVRPRCGVPDIVNGTTTMNSGKFNKLHSVAHFSFFPNRPTWGGKRDLTYYLDSSSQIVDSQRMSTIFSRAFSRWSAATTLTFQETDSRFLADIRIGFYSGDHGDGEPFDGILGTLAHAFSPPDGRLHLDAAENWNVDSVSVGFTQIDLESVAIHEIGHLLGLGHSSVEDAIMYPSITSGSRRVDLAGDDIEGIQVLYGSNPDFNSSTVPSTQERETNASWRLRRSLPTLTGGLIGLSLCLWL